MPDDSLNLDAFHDEMRGTFPPVATEDWLHKIIDDLKGADYQRRLVWHPDEGFDVQPFYRHEDLPAHVGNAFPSPSRRWHIRENVTASDASEARARAHRALERGATTIGFAVSTSPDTQGRIPLRSQKDLARLIDGLPLQTAPVHLVADLAARPLLAALADELARRDSPPDAFQGSVTVDPLGVLLRHGRLHTQPAFDRIAQLTADAESLAMHGHTLRVDARPFHEAGGTAVQELAFALAAAGEYLARLADRDCPAGRVAARLRFVVPIGSSYFMEIAKLRALRLLYPQLVHAFDAEADSPPPYVEAVTSRRHLTRYDAHVNLLRATTQVAAAVIGGCHEVAIHPFDAAATIPSDFAARLARNIPLILKHEGYLDAVTDPAAGSYYIEVLTDQLAREAWTLFQHVEARGGLMQALEDGFIQHALAQSRIRRRAALATGKRTLIGINQYPDLTESRADDRSPSPTEAGAHPALMLRYDAAVSLDAMQATLREGGSFDALLHTPPEQEVLTLEPLPAERWAEPLEALRLRTDMHVAETGKRPAVFLLPLGHPVMATARATFAQSFFGCAGFAILENPRFDTPEAGAQAALDRDADIVVICSSDQDYADVVPAVCAYIKAADSQCLVVVAGPADTLPDAVREAGVDAFAHRRSDMLETLTSFQNRLGIPVFDDRRPTTDDQLLS